MLLKLKLELSLVEVQVPGDLQASQRTMLTICSVLGIPEAIRSVLLSAHQIRGSAAVALMFLSAQHPKARA